MHWLADELIHKDGIGLRFVQQFFFSKMESRNGRATPHFNATRHAYVSIVFNIFNDREPVDKGYLRANVIL